IITFNPHLTFTFYSQQERDQQYPTVAKILVLDTGKFEQWQFWIQQYLQHEHYALWEVTEFGDSYTVSANSPSTTTTDTTSSVADTKSGRTVTLTAEDMQKKNDVKTRTTLVLSLPDKHQLRSKGSETLEQTFNKLSDLDTMSLDDLYNHLKVYESEVHKKLELNSQNMTFISSAKHSNGNEDGNTACVLTASTNVPTASASVATISQDTACAYIASQSSEFALIANTSAESKVFDNSLCSKDSLAQVESRLVEYKEREVKYCKKIRTLEFYNESNNECIEILKKKLETLKEEKEGVDGKLGGLLKVSKDLDNLIESQRTDKIKDGLGYSAVPPPPAQLYLSSKKDLSWTGLPECADDTVTDYSRPSPTIESTSGDDQNRNPSVSETVSSSITPKPFIKFIRPKDNQSKSKTGKTESLKKPPVKKRVKKNFTPKPVVHRPYRPSQRPMKTNMNGARPNRTSFNKHAHSYANRPFHRTSAVRSPHRAPWVPTVNRNFPPVNRKFPLDSGCSRHMTGNISYLSDFEPFDGGYVSFGQGGCKITRKGTIKTGKLEFENVYFVNDLKDFKLLDDANILLRTPREHNMYSIDLNNIVPHRDFTCLVAKASTDECILWHRRLGYLNFKTMNKLVRHNLVRGLPTKFFENDHTCTACLKGKQHKASCKYKLVNSVTKPLHTLHMDLFGPTSVSSISHKWYCLVVTDDFSRFTWTFFLRSKDETSDILKKFITEIENLKDFKVKIIRYDNRGEFRNKEMNDFCSQKGIKREFSNARTPQQNGVAERRNRTLIEVARTMLADAKLPVTFWAKAFNTACYVQNRVLVNKSQNKTPYELFNGRTPAIGFLYLIREPEG
nr:hypothetical protein [Tanacetum cinerariifolium]